MSLWKEGFKLLHEVTFENESPEICIELLEASLNFIGLQNRIKTADQKWVEEFIEQGGMEKVFDTLAMLSNNASRGLVDAVQQLECARCIKSVMNHQCGMEYFIKAGKELIYKLTEGLSSDSMLMKVEVYQLLSAVCMYSSTGHKLVIDAMAHLKNAKRTRLSVLLVDDLRAAETDEYRAVLVAFINCLLARCDSVDERSNIRHDLIALNFQQMLASMRTSEDDVLLTQIGIFNEGLALDQEVTEEGMDISNHKDVFRAVYTKVVGTPNALSFLHILQHLMLLDRDSKKCNVVWEMLEKMVLSAVMMSEGDQDAADQFVSASTEKMRKALAQALGVPVKSSSTSSPALPDDQAQTLPLSSAPPSSSTPSPTFTPPPACGHSAPPPPAGVCPVPPPPTSVCGPPAPPPPPLACGPPAPPPPPPLACGPPAPPPPPGAIPLPPGSIGTAAEDKSLDSYPAIFRSSFKFHSKKKLRILNWKKLSRNIVQAHKQCVWLQCPKLTYSNSIDSEIIEELFGRKELSTTTKEKHKESHTVCLLDNKTGLNVSVFLKQFKGGGNRAVIELVSAFNIKSITVEQLKALEKLLPDTNIIDFLKSYNGDQSVLGDAEIFLLELIKVDNYVLRVQAMRLFSELSEKKDEIQPALQLVCDAINEILKSESLKKIFYIVLATGNYINSGGHFGKAYGFTVTSLDKFGDTRANKAHMTYLHYVTSILQQQSPELLAVTEDVPHLKEASRYSTEYLIKQVNELENGLNEIQLKLDKAMSGGFRQQVEEAVTLAKSDVAELLAGVQQLTTGTSEIMEFFCEDGQQCKLQELLHCVLKFVESLSACAEENARLEAMEKKQEKRKAEHKASPAGPADVVDKLLHEIRDGTKLRHRCSK